MRHEMHLIFDALNKQETLKTKFLVYERLLIEKLQQNSSTLTITGRDNPNGEIIGPRGLITEDKTAVEVIILFKLGAKSTSAYVSVTIELKTEFGEVIGAVKMPNNMTWYRDLTLLAGDACTNARKQLFSEMED